MSGALWALTRRGDVGYLRHLQYQEWGVFSVYDPVGYELRNAATGHATRLVCVDFPGAIDEATALIQLAER